jgi:hypothetical protein
MITSATTVNTVYGQSAVNSTTNNKADAASFAAAFANASSTPAKTSSTASADKVTISAQAQQASAQDDIEAEAQALAKKTLETDSKDLPAGAVRLGWAMSGSMTQNNQKMMDTLQKQLNSMQNTPSINGAEAQQIRGKLATLASWGDKQDFTDAELTKQMQVHFRALEIMQPAGLLDNLAWKLCGDPTKGVA